MDRLKALTETLTDMSNVTVQTSVGVTEYKLEKGFAMAVMLKNNEEVAVAQSFMSKGTIFPYHNHNNSNEVLIVYSGEVTVVTDNEKTTLKEGDSLHVCKGCGHLLRAVTDVKIIAITIPPDLKVMPKIDKNGQG